MSYKKIPVDELSLTIKISEVKCPICGGTVTETRNAITFIQKCNKCAWKKEGLFL
jgi:hypothetical protein